MVLVADAPITRKLESRFFRFSDLQAMGIVGNWPTLLRWIAKGDFPPGVHPRLAGKRSRGLARIPPRWQGGKLADGSGI